MPLLPDVTGTIDVEPVRAQPVRDEVRDLRARVEPGRGAGVEVDDEPVGLVHAAARPDPPLRRVQLERALVRGPDEPRQVVEERQLELGALVVGARGGPDLLPTDPVGRAARRVLLEELLAVHAVGPADPGDGAVLQLREQRGRDAAPSSS